MFTPTDRDNVQAAMVRIVTDGVQTVTVGGQTVQVISIEQCNTLLGLIENNLAAVSNDGLGLRFRKFTPTYT